jgi:DNA-binding MarR family transcriptional regulator
LTLAARHATHTHTRAGRAVTELILEVFRLNGRLLAAGDQLVSDAGLTSARWQVLGAIALADTALPVAHLARNMGLTRQAVQRIANELEQEGFVTFENNPHHQRAKLVVLTKKGQAAYHAADTRQTPWANKLGARLRTRDVEAALEVLRSLTRALDTSE